MPANKSPEALQQTATKPPEPIKASENNPFKPVSLQTQASYRVRPIRSRSRIQGLLSAAAAFRVEAMPHPILPAFRSHHWTKSTVLGIFVSRADTRSVSSKVRSPPSGPLGPNSAMHTSFPVDTIVL